jgi:hypothetical protein
MLYGAREHQEGQLIRAFGIDQRVGSLKYVSEGKITLEPYLDSAIGVEALFVPDEVIFLRDWDECNLNDLCREYNT